MGDSEPAPSWLPVTPPERQSGRFSPPDPFPLAISSMTIKSKTPTPQKPAARPAAASARPARLAQKISPVLKMQRQAGNQAVGALLQDRRFEGGADLIAPDEAVQLEPGQMRKTDFLTSSMTPFARPQKRRWLAVEDPQTAAHTWPNGSNTSTNKTAVVSSVFYITMRPRPNCSPAPRHRSPWSPPAFQALYPPGLRPARSPVCQKD